MILTKEKQLLKTEFKAFTEQEIEPLARESDRKERISNSLIEKMSEKGYLGSMISTEYGGKGWDMVTLGILNEEIGKGCSSTRALLTVHGMVAVAIERWGTKHQKAEFLPMLAKGEKIGAFALTEPDVGSDAKSIMCAAQLEGDNYIINGIKKWITMGQIADFFLVMTKVNEKPTAFLVEKNSPGLTISPMKGLIGARASMLAELKFENCRIPADMLLGREGFGLTHIALNSLDYGRYTIAWGCVGLSQICIDKSLKYVKQRKQFGAALRKNQLIQKMISEMIVQTEASRQLCYHAGVLKDDNHPDSIVETWKAKYFSSKACVQVADYAVQIHGGNGCIDDYEIERYYRDAKINEIIEGTSQMHEILIAMNAFTKR